ncbi:MAG: hypothetical protein U1G05_12800 [Kiritimatiellia bacterium]
MEPYASGERLRGDDFSPEEIQAWFAAENRGIRRDRQGPPRHLPVRLERPQPP